MVQWLVAYLNYFGGPGFEAAVTLLHPLLFSAEYPGTIKLVSPLIYQGL